jgi:hypothetical protein
MRDSRIASSKPTALSQAPDPARCRSVLPQRASVTTWLYAQPR